MQVLESRAGWGLRLPKAPPLSIVAYAGWWGLAGGWPFLVPTAHPPGYSDKGQRQVVSPPCMGKSSGNDLLYPFERMMLVGGTNLLLTHVTY